MFEVCSEARSRLPFVYVAEEIHAGFMKPAADCGLRDSEELGHDLLSRPGAQHLDGSGQLSPFDQLPEVESVIAGCLDARELDTKSAKETVQKPLMLRWKVMLGH